MRAETKNRDETAPIANWLDKNLIVILKDRVPIPGVLPESKPGMDTVVETQLRAVSVRRLRVLLLPMGVGDRSTCSMGTIRHWLCLSNKSQLLFKYFKGSCSRK